jgi:transcriptional regulator with XRE-family HTH domain
MYPRPRVSSQAPLHVRSLVAGNIRRLQNERGMNGRQIADAIGVTPDQFSKWRRGDVLPGPAYLMQLAGVLADGDLSAFYGVVEEEVPA